MARIPDSFKLKYLLTLRTSLKIFGHIQNEIKQLMQKILGHPQTRYDIKDWPRSEIKLGHTQIHDDILN